MVRYNVTRGAAFDRLVLNIGDAGATPALYVLSKALEYASSCPILRFIRVVLRTLFPCVRSNDKTLHTAQGLSKGHVYRVAGRGRHRAHRGQPAMYVLSG